MFVITELSEQVKSNSYKKTFLYFHEDFLEPRSPAVAPISHRTAFYPIWYLDPVNLYKILLTYIELEVKACLSTP
jgi:hypothetical protein